MSRAQLVCVTSTARGVSLSSPPSALWIGCFHKHHAVNFPRFEIIHLVCTFFFFSLPDALRAAWPRSIPDPRPALLPSIGHQVRHTCALRSFAPSEEPLSYHRRPPIPCSSSALAALVARNASAGLILTSRMHSNDTVCTGALAESCSWWLARTTSHDGHPPLQADSGPGRSLWPSFFPHQSPWPSPIGAFRPSSSLFCWIRCGVTAAKADLIPKERSAPWPWVSRRISHLSA